MAKQSQKLLLMLVIGVLIGTTGVMAWKTRTVGEGEEVLNSTDNNASTTIDGLSKRDSLTHALSLPLAPSIPKGSRIGLSVEDQIAGNLISISGLELKENHWVAIYDQREGQLGWIMGATRVRAGDTSAVIELLRPTISGETYYAGILSDDGDEVFNRQTDLPPLSSDKMTIVSFMAL